MQRVENSCGKKILQYLIASATIPIWCKITIFCQSAEKSKGMHKKITRRLPLPGIISSFSLLLPWLRAERGWVILQTWRTKHYNTATATGLWESHKLLRESIRRSALSGLRATRTIFPFCADGVRKETLATGQCNAKTSKKELWERERNCTTRRRQTFGEKVILKEFRRFVF